MKGQFHEDGDVVSGGSATALYISCHLDTDSTGSRALIRLTFGRGRNETMFDS